MDALDDLALGSSDDGGGGGESAPAGDKSNAAVEVANNGATDDPWAVLAAAAGEEPPAPAVATPAPAADTTQPLEISSEGAGVEAPSLAHAEGETFTMPSADGDRPTLAAQIQSSTAQLGSVLQTKINEVDEKIGATAKARDVDQQYHISEKWGEFNTNVLQPTTARTVEKTREVSASVKEKVGPSVKEHWGSIQRRTTEMGIAEKWSSLSAQAGEKIRETREKAGEGVEHWKEEQEKKRALANAGGGENGGGLAPQLEGAREKVVEGWNGGVGWMSQKIQEAKRNREKQRTNGIGRSDALDGDKELSRLDSNGFPSSFRK